MRSMQGVEGGTGSPQAGPRQRGRLSQPDRVVLLASIASVSSVFAMALVILA